MHIFLPRFENVKDVVSFEKMHILKNEQKSKIRVVHNNKNYGFINKPTILISIYFFVVVFVILFAFEKSYARY